MLQQHNVYFSGFLKRIIDSLSIDIGLHFSLNSNIP